MLPVLDTDKQVNRKEKKVEKEFEKKCKNQTQKRSA